MRLPEFAKKSCGKRGGGGVGWFAYCVSILDMCVFK